MTTLEDAHVLITGGSQGIGFATAQRVLDRGGRVSIVARDAEKLAVAEDALESRVGDPTRVCAETADVTDREGFETALGLIIAQFGPSTSWSPTQVVHVPGCSPTRPSTTSSSR